MRRSLLALTTMLYGTTLSAQQRGPGFDPGSVPLAAGVTTTVLPILAGITMMVPEKEIRTRGRPPRGSCWPPGACCWVPRSETGPADSADGGSPDSGSGPWRWSAG